MASRKDLDELALADWKGQPAGEKLVLDYGHNWKELNFIRVTTKETDPDVEEGWVMCMLCMKKLGGPWHALSHIESKKHQAWLKWAARTPDAKEQVEAWRKSKWSSEVEELPNKQDHHHREELTKMPLPTPARSARDWLAPSRKQRELGLRNFDDDPIPREDYDPNSRMRGWRMPEEVLPPVLTSNFDQRDSTTHADSAGIAQQPGLPRHVIEVVDDSVAASSSDPFKVSHGADTQLSREGECGGPASEQATELDPSTLRCNEAYDGLEINEAAGQEYGYLDLASGDLVTQLSEASNGHSANRFPKYAWGLALRTKMEGWFPTAIMTPVLSAELHQRLGVADDLEVGAYVRKRCAEVNGAVGAQRC
eukprot:CAMPEP_0206563568 /NCGR_PEP_ID=MMETSP0325_2-20121206/22926_1 /ASSEMBLY_ACC=CAM_ASM_000347 /TAXON_ID=2866 /ORGANISM="Crypthecodinium cohnii, Strain Seligo" /LENGTH=365 /DNA_ID=CAMNT_0054066003 /DNA_START=88 /DNA_END=1183 /DNA_ORIENTATION=-